MRSLLLALCFTPLLAAAQVPAALTLDDALRITHERQPLIKVARAQTDAARARVGEALSPWLPQVSLALGYSRSTANFVARPGSLPSSVNSSSTALSLQGYDFFTSSLGVQQLLWDFGQTWNQWDASKATLTSQAQTERAIFVTADLTLRTAYFNAVAQKELIGVAVATLSNTDAHLKQVQGFVQAGTHPEIDLAQSRSDRANARLQLVTAKNAYTVAKAKLNQAMGVEGSTDYEVVDKGTGEVDLEANPMEDVIKVAVTARPEVASLDAKVQAQELTLRSIRGNYWPTFSAQASGTAQSRTFTSWTPNLSFGLNASWQLYQGGLTISQVSENEYILAQLQGQLDITRQQIRLDVEQAMLDVGAGKEGLEVSQEALDAALENQRLAEGRYNAGAGSIIEWGDAQVRVTTAQASLVQARFTLASARARLLAALGR